MIDSLQHANFPATQWSIILRARGASSVPTREALEVLCRIYWPPLYAFLRRNGSSPSEAQDIVQGFLARLLERHDLATVDPEHGRFRSYLLAGLRNFLVSEVRHDHAQKRGGDAVVFSFDSEEAENVCRGVIAAGLPPDQAFDRRWAETILERAVEVLRREYFARGKGVLFEMLKPSLAGDPTENRVIWARHLGMTTGAVTVAVHRLRARLRELVRLDVAQTVGSHEAVEEEMRHLLTILSG
jgi:RNA polymerase sigma-70 factor (ECF subfamily)